MACNVLLDVYVSGEMVKMKMGLQLFVDSELFH